MHSKIFCHRAVPGVTYSCLVPALQKQPGIGCYKAHRPFREPTRGSLGSVLVRLLHHKPCTNGAENRQAQLLLCTGATGVTVMMMMSLTITAGSCEMHVNLLHHKPCLGLACDTRLLYCGKLPGGPQHTPSSSTQFTNT